LSFHPIFFGLIGRVPVKLDAGHPLAAPIALDPIEQHSSGRGTGDHFRVRTRGERRPGITFVSLPDQPHVDEENIFVSQFGLTFGSLITGSLKPNDADYKIAAATITQLVLRGVVPKVEDEKQVAAFTT
jgi:hypothetical protein